MRPVKLRRPSPMKRRCPAPLSSSLRFTSLLLIVAAVCEFSGLSQALLDTLAPPPAQNVTLAVPQPAPRTRPPLPRNFYPSVDPSLSVDEFLAMRQVEGGKVRPTFELEMYWTRPNFGDKVCRIHNVCLNENGMLLLHPWMKAHAAHLAECAVRNYAFMKDAAEFDVSDTTASYDLLGVVPTRYHIPHFVTDLLPLLYALQLLRPTFATDVQSVCEGPGRRRCAKNVTKEDLRALLYAQDRVGGMMIGAWVPQALRMALGDVGLQFEGNGTRKCFRSVVAFDKHSVVKMGNEWYREANGMFDRFGLTRKPKEKQKRAQCHLDVRVLNRVGWVKRGGIYQGRDLVNVEQVVDELERQAKMRGVGINTRIEYFENATFAEQVEVMQSADAILGVHGAGLGNILFVREGVPLIEVLPYGYLAGPFDELARALYLPYSREVAQADDGGFRECMDVLKDKWGGEKALKRGIKVWEEGLRVGLKAHRITEREIVPVKLCARSQRMRVDAGQLARKVLDMAVMACTDE